LEVSVMHKLSAMALLSGVICACSGGHESSLRGSTGGSDGAGTGGAAPNAGGSGGMTLAAGAGGTVLGSGGTAGSPAGMAGSAGRTTGAGGAAAGSGGTAAGHGGTPAGAAGQAGTGGAGTDPNWPTYEEAEAGPHSTRVLVLLLDFADSDQDDMLPNAEQRWGELIFGREHSQGNNYWYETSGGQFQLLPAPETQLTQNNGVVHIKVSETKPTTGVLVAQDQPWIPEALDMAAEFVDFASFDKDGDHILQNSELSVLFIINWEFAQIANAPAEANIVLDYPILGTGVTLDKFARDMYLHTSIGIAMHELGHHVLDLDHTPGPTDHDLMGQGEYWPDPVVPTLSDPNWFNATRPTELKAMHKVRSGFVTPTEITGSTQGVKLYAPELGKQYNVLKLPVAEGFLLIDNRHANDYDASIPFCNGEAGAIFVDDVSQYLEPLALANAPSGTDTDTAYPEPSFCDIYALAGHNDTFTYGGWKISNVSAPGPVMTLDIEKLDVPSTIDHYTLETYWDSTGERIRHETRLDGSASTFDFSQQSGGTSIDGFVSIGMNAVYTTGEDRSVSLDTTYSSDSPYLQVQNAGEFTNGGCPTPDTLTYVTIDPSAPHVTSAKVTFTNGSFVHTVTFTNLPQN
jgi:M6 family metalloprotease-like protein